MFGIRVLLLHESTINVDLTRRLSDGCRHKVLVTMTPAQCRAARALLDLTQPKLAISAGLGLSTVVDYERSRRDVSADAIDGIRLALETAGVIFVEENGEGLGVRLRKSAPADNHPRPVGPATEVVKAMDAAIERHKSGAASPKLTINAEDLNSSSDD